DGRTLTVHTPFTPRPFDHALSNARGHLMTVTNRGLHTTASWNSQQNRLTPDWPDTVTREVPAEAMYLFDPNTGEWFSPTYNHLFFVNPRNHFRTRPAFVSLSCPALRVETWRGRFSGRGRGIADPYLVEHGEPDAGADQDDRPIAAFLAELEVPARGECTVVV